MNRITGDMPFVDEGRPMLTASDTKIQTAKIRRTGSGIRLIIEVQRALKPGRDGVSMYANLHSRRLNGKGPASERKRCAGANDLGYVHRRLWPDRWRDAQPQEGKRSLRLTITRENKGAAGLTAGGFFACKTAYKFHQSIDVMIETRSQ
jgi:hypothetical protein